MELSKVLSALHDELAEWGIDIRRNSRWKLTGHNVIRETEHKYACHFTWMKEIIVGKEVVYKRYIKVVACITTAFNQTYLELAEPPLLSIRDKYNEPMACWTSKTDEEEDMDAMEAYFHELHLKQIESDEYDRICDGWPHKT